MFDLTFRKFYAHLIGPKLKALIEADGIVMTSEMEIANLIEQYLSIQINIDKNLIYKKKNYSSKNSQNY